jgi:hypothetical protein
MMAVSSVFSQLMVKHHWSERRVAAAYAARAILNHETMKPYIDIVNIAQTNFGQIGNVYENADLSDMTYQMTVDCADSTNYAASDMDLWSWTVTCDSGNDDFKRMTLVIGHTELGDMTFTSIVADTDHMQ